ncbi:PD-(D/E)XK nuclease family protein [Candidatus Pacearchaeota archaeon]|nr:PD-(D/E)XK nuclease family protein [Candidatus Pacearchaeota archaeon]
MPFKLSPHTISLMQECPRCFWLEKHEIWQRPEGITASLMNGMDRILKTHFDKFRDKGEMPPELVNNHNEECKNLKLFDDAELLDKWRYYKQGIVWQDENNNILMGAIDNLLVNKKNNKLIVLDYKTRGFPLKENTHEYYQNQLDIYNFLLRNNGYETEDYAFLLFYIPKEVLPTGEVLFDTTLKKVKINVLNAEYLFNKAIKLLNGDCPKEVCEWCENVKF